MLLHLINACFCFHRQKNTQSYLQNMPLCNPCLSFASLSLSLSLSNHRVGCANRGCGCVWPKRLSRKQEFHKNSTGQVKLTNIPCLNVPWCAECSLQCTWSQNRNVKKSPSQSLMPSNSTEMVLVLGNLAIFLDAEQHFWCVLD